MEGGGELGGGFSILNSGPLAVQFTPKQSSVRWAAKGHGKSGGVRVISYWWTAEGRITLADIYPKNEKENLSAAEVAKLRKDVGL